MDDSNFLARHAAGLDRGEQAGRDAVEELQRRLDATKAKLEAAADPRFSIEHRAIERRKIVEAAAAGAMTYLRDQDVIGKLERLAETAKAYTSPDILRRATFTSIVDAAGNPLAENLAALRHITEASRMPITMITAATRDAIEDGKWAVTHSLRAEIQRRAAGQSSGPVHDARVEVDMMVGASIHPLIERATEVRRSAETMRRQIGFLVNKLEGKTALSGTPQQQVA